jgi:hypothetical protein
MRGGQSDYRWMAVLLELLFERFTREEALALLRDLEARETAIGWLAPELDRAGLPHGMLTTQEGQNLFVAVLGLRLKFQIQEAREKVSLNIAMRAGQSPDRP